jgi:hypothetical protein
MPCAAKPFFIPMTHEESCDMWEHQSPIEQGSEVRSHRTRGSTGAYLRGGAMSGAEGHVTAPEPS